MTAVGVVLGALMAAGLARFIEAQLYGVQPMDWVSFLGTALLMLTAAAAASIAPAVRALRLDPIAALRATRSQAAGAGHTSAKPARLDSEKVGSGAEVPAVGIGGETAFRYDPVEGPYIFNGSTKGLPAGTWQLRRPVAQVIPDPGPERSRRPREILCGGQPVSWRTGSENLEAVRSSVTGSTRLPSQLVLVNGGCPVLMWTGRLPPRVRAGPRPRAPPPGAEGTRGRAASPGP
jgi:hypothetical protein